MNEGRAWRVRQKTDTVWFCKPWHGEWISFRVKWEALVEF